jgi:hypothetical protein
VTRRATPRTTYVVEHYRPGLKGDELRQQAERFRDAVTEMARAGKSIRHLSTTVVPGDDYFQSVLQASSERLVREAHRRAGTSFERISVAIPIESIEERMKPGGRSDARAN